MRVSWRAAPGNVLQYQVAYKPDGGERKEMFVKGDTTTALLRNLLPDTEYELFVSARYTSGLGAPLMGTGTTLEGKTLLYCIRSFLYKEINLSAVHCMKLS